MISLFGSFQISNDSKLSMNVLWNFVEYIYSGPKSMTGLRKMNFNRKMSICMGMEHIGTESENSQEKNEL